MVFFGSKTSPVRSHPETQDLLPKWIDGDHVVVLKGHTQKSQSFPGFKKSFQNMQHASTCIYKYQHTSHPD